MIQRKNVKCFKNFFTSNNILAKGESDSRVGVGIHAGHKATDGPDIVGPSQLKI